MNKFKEIKKELSLQKKQRQYQKDEEGRAIICMNVKNDEGFLSEFSESDTPVISSEVAEFIENSTSFIPISEELTLRIHSDCIDDQEKVLYNSAIKEYYLQKYITNEQEIKRNRLLVLFLGLAGILVLAAELIYDFCVGNAMWTEVIDIVAWVLLWEATDIALLAARGLRRKQKRFLAFLSMKVEFAASRTCMPLR